MGSKGIEVKMAPPHPGDFIRTEIVQELGLSVDETARILGSQSEGAFRGPKRSVLTVA